MNLDPKPVVASYCATFLKPEMLHIYRQITALRRVRPVVITQKRENTDRFPFRDIILVNKPRAQFLRRFWYRQLQDAPWQISPAETEQLICLLDQHDAKLLHVYFGHIAVHLAPLIQNWHRPCLVSFHGADVAVDLQKPVYRAATEKMLSAVRRVLVRSDSLRQALIRLGCKPEKIEVQRTGIPMDQFPFRQRNAPVGGQWRLLQAGRLIEKKGYQTSLRAFARFHREFPCSTLVIAGEGPQLRELKKSARELNIAAAVRFAGFIGQEELRDLFYSSHLFLHPSETGADGNQEGVPNSMLEAMATGLPVFATFHGGIPEAIEDEQTGILVCERDQESLAAKLIAAVRNPGRIFAIGRLGSESVVRNFDHREQTRRLQDIYLREIEATP